jgi:hypothetical protein
MMMPGGHGLHTKVTLSRTFDGLEACPLILEIMALTK